MRGWVGLGGAQAGGTGSRYRSAPRGGICARRSTCSLRPHQAAGRAARPAYAIIDGTLIPIDRVADQRPYYPRTRKRHGVNVQVLVDPAGRLMWASPALPGAVHDLTVARAQHLIEASGRAEVMTTKLRRSPHRATAILVLQHRRRPLPTMKMAQ